MSTTKRKRRKPLSAVTETPETIDVRERFRIMGGNVAVAVLNGLTDEIGISFSEKNVTIAKRIGGEKLKSDGWHEHVKDMDAKDRENEQEVVEVERLLAESRAETKREQDGRLTDREQAQAHLNTMLGIVNTELTDVKEQLSRARHKLAVIGSQVEGARIDGAS